MDFLCKVVNNKSGVSLIPKKYTVKQWSSYYYRVMKKAGITKELLGVTSHGLRHEYAQEHYFQTTGVLAPIIMKASKNLVSVDHNKNGRLVVSKLLGHSRENISDIYGCWK